MVVLINVAAVRCGMQFAVYYIDKNITHAAILKMP
jgi:hypothetical protein